MVTKGHISRLLDQNRGNWETFLYGGGKDSKQRTESKSKINSALMNEDKYMSTPAAKQSLLLSQQ